MTATQAEHDDLQNRLSYHPPATPAIAEKHDQVRTLHLSLGHWILDNVPPGRHRSLALTAVQEAMIWSNAAVACDTKPPSDA